MNYIDIILIIPIVWAVYKGLKDGIAVQLGGIVGLLLGVWLAYQFGETVAKWFGVKGDVAPIVGFIIVLAIVLLAVFLLSRAARGVIKKVGMGAFDKVGGAILSVCKIVILLSLLISLFELGNNKYSWIKNKTLNGSVLYNPIEAVVKYVFPYYNDLKKRVMDDDQGILNKKR